MNVRHFSEWIALINAAPPVHGLEEFIGVYFLNDHHKALIDVGPTSALGRVYAGLAELGTRPEQIDYIFTSHVHVDHNGGLGQAVQRMPAAQVIAHEKGIPHLIDPRRLWESSLKTIPDLTPAYGQPEPVPPERIVAVRDGMVFDLGQMTIQAVLTPGHASHHISYFETEKRQLFVGEAAGIYLEDLDIVRPASPPPFHLEQSLDSLDKLVHLKPSKIFYAHFGASDNAVERLVSYRQQLILWGKIISRFAAGQADWEEIYFEIRKKDRSIDWASTVSTEQMQREMSFIRNSIAGYLDYFNKYGTSCIDRL